MKRLLSVFIFASVVSSLGVAFAETATSQPAGFVKINCPAASDTIVSVPFHQSAVFTGLVSGAPVEAAGNTTITLNGAPGFTGDSLVGTHYVRLIGTSTNAGRVFEVTGNTAVGLTVAAEAGLISDGDQLKVVPHWTLDSLFPVGTQDTIHASTSLLPTDRSTRILFFDNATGGIDLAPDRIFFLTTKWVESTSGFPDAGDVVIPPGMSFVIRHPSGVVATNYIPHQFVEMDKTAAILPVSTSARDVTISLDRPVPVKLSDLDIESAFAVSASTAPGDRGDELHVFDNTVAAVNKLPSAVYFRIDGEWKEDTTGFPTADDDTIAPGSGILIRKAAAGSAGTTVWVNTPRF